MYPFYPFFNPFFPARRRILRSLPTYKVSTTGVQPNGATITDLTISAATYNALPNEAILLFDITQAVPPTRDDTEVNVTAGTTVVRRMVVTDSDNDVVTGNNLTVATEKQVYFNKATNTFRILNFINTAPTAAETEDEGAEAATLSTQTRTAKN